MDISEQTPPVYPIPREEIVALCCVGGELPTYYYEQETRLVPDQMTSPGELSFIYVVMKLTIA